MERKILIAGGGLTGLLTALALKRASDKYSLDLEIHIYESRALESTHDNPLDTLTPHNESNANETPKLYLQTGPLYHLSNPALAHLEELGIDIKHCSSQLTSLTHTDYITKTVLTQYPPNALRDKSEILPLHSTKKEFMTAITHGDLLKSIVKAFNPETQELNSPHSYSSSPHSQDINDDENLNVDKDVDIRQIPNLHFNHTLQTFVISSTTGIITAQFTNGEIVYGSILIGADGVHSTVRLCLDDRSVARYNGNVVFSGYTYANNTHNSANLHNHANNETSAKESDLSKEIPLNTAHSYLGTNIQFGCTNKVNQPTPNALLETLRISLTRKRISTALSENPYASIIKATPLIDHTRISVTHSNLPTTPTDDALLFATQTPTSNDIHSLASSLPSLDSLPPYCKYLVHSSHSTTLTCEDTYDLSNTSLHSYSSPEFMKGRVIILGDAAHASSVSVHQNQSVTDAIHDATLLAKLFAGCFGRSDDGDALKVISDRFDGGCVGDLRNMREARGGEGVEKMSGGMRRVWGYGYSFMGDVYKGEGYRRMIERGRIEDGLPLLY